MTEPTDFSRFREAAEELLGVKVVQGIRRDMETMGIEVDPNDVSFGTSGLFCLIFRDGQTYVTRGLLHIADKASHFLTSRGLGESRDELLRVKDTPEFLDAIHKYHFYFCTTLRGMHDEGNEQRYRMAHNTSGEFFYEIIDGFDPPFTIEEQRLYPCMHCLKMFQERLGQAWKFDRERFLPDMFFDRTAEDEWLPDCGYLLDTQSVGKNRYTPDFERIAERVKSYQNYVCQKCNKSLANPDLRKYLHCHHKNADKQDNRQRNLQCLCIKCHAEQYKHGHMKRLPAYSEFLPIWKALPPASGKP